MQIMWHILKIQPTREKKKKQIICSYYEQMKQGIGFMFKFSVGIDKQQTKIVEIEEQWQNKLLFPVYAFTSMTMTIW